MSHDFWLGMADQSHHPRRSAPKTTDTTPTFTHDEVFGRTLDDEDRAELQAHRDGIGHIAEDPMHAGQPVHVEYRYQDGEPVYRLQVTHSETPLWQCDRCRKLTISSSPGACVGCGLNAIEALEPLLYPTPATCRSAMAIYVDDYDGSCLIAGSDGCECSDDPQTA